MRFDCRQKHLQAVIRDTYDGELLVVRTCSFYVQISNTYVHYQLK